MSNKNIYRCYRQQNVLCLRAAISNQKEQPIIIRLLIDTGASYTVIPIPILKRINCDVENPIKRKKIVTANGAIDVPIIVVPAFNCMGIKQKEFSVVGLNLPVNSFTDGLLGMDFLREAKAVIDIAKAEIRLN